MYTFLSSAIADVFVEELRLFWKFHPKYPDLVSNIQGKYSFSERPQRGIVVKPSGGEHSPLSADNFQGTVYGYASLVKVADFPGISVEWVREDSVAIQNSGGRFPSPPGYYYVTITSSSLDDRGVPTGSHQFVVSPRLTVTDEGVTLVNGTDGVLRHPFVPGSLRLYEMPQARELVEDVNFSADPETGSVVMFDPVPPGLYVSADYTYVGDERGPFDISEDRAHFQAIPGVIMAFGRRITPGDQFAIQVAESREPVAREYGGRWNTSVEIELWARDVHDQREMHDLTSTFLASVLKDRLSGRGIEIRGPSLGGEIEEQYDETADDYFYGSSLSVECQTDWSIHVPIVGRIRDISPLSYDQVQELAGLSDDDIVLIQTNLRSVDSLSDRGFRDPFFTRKTRFPMVR